MIIKLTSMSNLPQLPFDVISYILEFTDPYNKVSLFNSCIDQMKYHLKEYDYRTKTDSLSCIYGAPQHLFYRYILWKNTIKNILDYRGTKRPQYKLNARLISSRSTRNPNLVIM